MKREMCTHIGIADMTVVWIGVELNGMEKEARHDEQNRTKQNKTEYSIRIIISVFNIVAPKTK